MANFQTPQRHIFGTYLNIARANFYKTILHVFSASGIDCYTKRGDLFVREDTVDKVISALYLIVNGENAGYHAIKEIVSKSYDKRWKEDKALQGNLSGSELKARKEEFKSPLKDEGPDGEDARICKSFTLGSEQEERMRKLLFRHIPLLSPIMADVVAMQFKETTNEHQEANKTLHDATLADCFKELSNIARCLSESRNFYTHKNPYNSIEAQRTQLQLQKVIANNLDKAFIGSRRIAKKRNSYSEKDLAFLTGHDNDCRMEEIFVLDENGNKIWKVEKDKNGKDKLDKDKNPIYVYKKVKAKDGKGREKLDEKGKPVYETLRENGEPVHEYEKKFVERKDFYFRIRGKREVLAPDLTPTGEECDGLSAFGMLYFCSLFLSKEQTAQLCTESRVFVTSPYQPAGNLKNNIILNMMFVYAIHIPRGKRLDSETDSQALGMDMLNELRRCPIELYDVLPSIGKRDFEDNVKHENNRTPELSKRIRLKDRFPYLAMRYIDQQQLFKRIRFHVRLGSFRFCFYDKTCIDGKSHPRQLHKDINGFGRLQDMEKERKEQYGHFFQQSREQSIWQKDENAYVNLKQLEPIKAGDQPHITDMFAQYNIHQNRIGLFWNTDEECKLVNKTNAQGEIIYNGYYLPPLNYVDSPTENNKHKRKAPVDMPAPLCSLSVFELPAMLFYNFLRNTDSLGGEEFPDVEEIVIKQYDNIRKFFLEVKDIQPTDNIENLATILNAYGLSKQSVPKKIYDYLSNKNTLISKDIRKSTEKEVKNRLRRAIIRKQRFEQDQEHIENTKDNKIGKDSFVSIRYAKIAEELAKSMMEWQSGNTKMTGLNFRVLTAALAKFGDGVIKRDTIISMLQKAEIMGGDNPHCFIEQAIEQEQYDIEEFYLDYISAEIEYLKRFLMIDGKTIILKDEQLLDALRKDKEVHDDVRIRLKNDVDFGQLPFIHKSRLRWQQSKIEELANRYLYVKEEGEETLGRATLLLPDGMFFPYIMKGFQKCHQELTNSIEALSDEQKKGIENNVAYLINLYFESKGEKSQSFYDSTEPSHYNDNIRQLAPYKYARSYEFFKIIKGWQIHLSCDEMKKRLTGKKTIIDNKINALKEKGNYISLEEAKNALRRKLHNTFRDMQDNERVIRRYKTQDRILFLMARDMMGEIVNKKADLFKLENVCKDDFLSQKVKASIAVHLSMGEVFKIQKDEMAIKDYGKLYRLLRDDRITKLLSYALYETGETIDYDDITDELKEYESCRSAAFEAVQMIEDTRYQQDKEVLSNPNENNFYCGNIRYKNGKDNGRENEAKRNNFRTLLEDLQKFTPEQMEMFSQEDRELIISIRNAFGHNSYPKQVDFERLINQERKNNPNFKIELKQVASFILDKLEEYVNQVNPQT